MATINTEVRNPKGRVFRRLWMKRRSATTGLFETSWVNISSDVKRWGVISRSIDYERYGKAVLSDVSIIMANDRGKYNPEDDEASLWYNYASQQRTLIKIEAGFIHQTQGSNGIWTNTEFPADPTVFIGFIQGDLSVSDDNEVAFQVRPLLQVFRDFPVRELSGYTTTGRTASQFITMLRDQTDGSSNFIFRPFFNDTTSSWDFTTTTLNYPDIVNTTASVRPNLQNGPSYNDFYDMNVWDVIEKLAEIEDLTAFITRTGTFRFRGRGVNSATSAWDFYGRGYLNSDYGVTIKRINRYGKRLSNYYSRVQVKWNEMGTSGSVVVTQTALVVSGTNNPWKYGHRTFEVENNWINTVTSAQTLAQNIFQTVSTLTAELDFTTSFIPHLELLETIRVSYDTSEKGILSRWDLADWADNTATSDLVWSNPVGDAIAFSNKQFKLVSIELDLDNLESRFIGIAL